MASASLRLTVRREGATLGSQTLNKERISIGRAASSDIVIASDQVARIHAVLERKLDGTGYVIVNMSSAGVTRLNGEPIERCELCPGDQVGIGDVILDFEAGSARAPVNDLVLWSATTDEMMAAEITGKSEPIILLTKRKQKQYYSLADL
jgi:pSer/pThr/pTyr-binding forkhead associated (FHA) protein